MLTNYNHPRPVTQPSLLLCHDIEQSTVNGLVAAHPPHSRRHRRLGSKTSRPAAGHPAAPPTARATQARFRSGDTLDAHDAAAATLQGRPVTRALGLMRTERRVFSAAVVTLVAREGDEGGGATDREPFADKVAFLATFPVSFFLLLPVHALVGLCLCRKLAWTENPGGGGPGVSPSFTDAALPFAHSFVLSKTSPVVVVPFYFI